MMSMYDRLKEKLSEFENKLAQCEVERDIRKAQRQQELNQLQENFEKRTNALISKIDDLKRKESIMLILLKISPEVPKNFPKNYCCKVVYEDEVHTGNHKLLDFEDTIINDKFILPLLLTTTVRVEIWTVEEEATLVDSGQINLERDIQNAIISGSYQGEIALEHSAESDTKIQYQLQIQGIGFASWLRNIAEMRELEADKVYSYQQIKVKRELMREKMKNKKQKFEAIFCLQDGQSLTEEYDQSDLNSILEDLKG